MEKNNKFVSLFKNHWDIICLIIGTAVYLAYVLYVFVELPYESFIDKFYLIEPFYSGTLKFSDLLIPYTENGMLAANVLFLINLKLFHFSVFVESMVNVMMVIFVGWISIFKYANKVSEERKWFYYIAVAVMTIPLFSCMQQSAGGMSLQVRFGFAAFVLVSYMIDRFLIENKNLAYYILTIVMIFLSINFFGSSYSFGGVPFVCLVVLICMIRDKKILDVKRILIIIAYVAATVLYFFEYGFIGGPSGEVRVVDGGLMDKALAFITNVKSIVMGLIYWNSSCLLGRYIFEDGKISNNGYLLVGVFFTIVILVSLFLYFKTKMYEKTWIPIMWIGYNLVLFFIICIGRVEVIKTLGEAWVTSSWYTVNTKILTVSVIGIYMYYFNQIEGKAIVRKSAICIVHLVMGGLLIWGTFWNAARVPFEKVNLTQMQSYFFVESKEDLPVDGNGTTPLFKDLDTSWDAIELLKKYHLSLFRDYSD